MKKVITATCLAFILVLGTALPALASEKVPSCVQYNGSGNTGVKICTSVNQSDLSNKLQALVEIFTPAGRNPVQCVWVDHHASTGGTDSAALYKNGVNITSVDGIGGCNSYPGDFTSTPWQNCDYTNAVYHAASWVKIKFNPGESSTWKYDPTANWDPDAVQCNGT